MFLNAQSESLDILFRIQHGDGSYMIFAMIDSLRCFECGDLGHKKFTCPHKKQSENGENARNNHEQTDQSKNSESRDKGKQHIAVKDVMIPGKKTEDKWG